MYEEELFSSRTRVQCPTPVSPVKRPYSYSAKHNQAASFLLNIIREDFSFPNYSLFLQKVRR